VIPIQERKNGVSFCVHVLPRSAKCALAGAQEGALRIKLTAPPVDGKANDECLEFLAGILGVKKGQMDIISGHTSRRKIVQIMNVPREPLENRLSTLLQDKLSGKDGRKDTASGRKA